MIKFQLKLLCLGLTLLLWGMLKPPAAQAQRPPYLFSTTYSHQDKLISYQLLFRKRDDTVLNDFTVKIPIPAGTRFVKADGPANSTSKFDGAEVSFSTIALPAAWQVSFTVEITAPSQTVFGTQVWTSWV